jgi:hypothetical protein
MPPTSSLYRTIDRQLDGKLGATLLELRAEDRSFDDIVRELGRLDVYVSKQTVANWLADLAPEPSPDRAA